MNAVSIAEAQNLARHYRVRQSLLGGHATLKALDGVSFSLRGGKTLAVVGESGCGKSTLARQLTLIEPPTSGHLLIDGNDVAGAGGARLAEIRRRVQIVFQDPYASLNPRKMVILSNASSAPRLSPPHRPTKLMQQTSSDSLSNVHALLFDLGGVVIDIDFNLAFAQWQRCSRLSMQQIQNEFCMDEAYQKHERGEMDQRAYFEHLRGKLALNGSDADIASGWNAIFVGVIHEALQCIRAVNGRLPCFAFSNSNPTHQVAWMNDYPQVVEAFDKVFVSSEMGARKPEEAAFRAIARETGVALERTLFFDDTLENVEGARQVGLQTIHVREPADVRSALSACGIL